MEDKMTKLQALKLTKAKWQWLSGGGKLKDWSRFDEVKDLDSYCPLCDWNHKRSCNLCPIGYTNWCFDSWKTKRPPKKVKSPSQTYLEFWNQPGDDRTFKTAGKDLVKILTRLIKECEQHES